MFGTKNLVKSLAIIAGIVLSITSWAGGRNGASASATVTVSVRPFVIVSPETTSVNVTVANVGLTSATVTFHVCANTATLHMAAAATALYRTSDSNAEQTTPIPLHLASGAAIIPNDTTARVDYVEDTMLDGMPAKSTRLISFQSDQPNRFNQDVGVTVTWNQSDPTRLTGLYCGKVRLTAMIMP